MGRIVIELDDLGQLKLASDFDQANTLLLMEKAKPAVLKSPDRPQPGIVEAKAVPQNGPGRG